MYRLSILQSPVPVKMSTTRMFTVFLIVVVTLILDIYEEHSPLHYLNNEKFQQEHLIERYSALTLGVLGILVSSVLGSEQIFGVVTGYFCVQYWCAPPDSSNITVKDFCIKEIKISKEKVDEIEKNPDAGTDDEEVLCYTHCVMVTLGVIDDDGAIAVENFKKNFDGFDMECVKKIPKIENCTDLSALDDCKEEYHFLLHRI